MCILMGLTAGNAAGYRGGVINTGIEDILVLPAVPVVTLLPGPLLRDGFSHVLGLRIVVPDQKLVMTLRLMETQFFQSVVRIAFPSPFSTCSELTFSFVAIVRDAVAASSFAGAVITWETMSRCGTARTSSTVTALLDFPRGPVKLIGELTVHTVAGTVVGFTTVCNHEAPLVLDCSRFAHLAETLRAPAGLLVVTRQETGRCMSGSLQS